MFLNSFTRSFSLATVGGILVLVLLSDLEASDLHRRFSMQRHFAWPAVHTVQGSQEPRAPPAFLIVSILQTQPDEKHGAALCPAGFQSVSLLAAR